MAVDIERELQIADPLQELIERARKDSTIFLENILEHFPDAKESELDQVISQIEDAGIEIVDREGKDGDGRKFDASADDDILGIYLTEASETPLLTEEEEVLLSKRMERGKSARAVFSNGKLLSKSEREKLLTQIQDGKNAYDHLASANQRLVIHIAKRYMGQGVKLLDLIQEGNDGLMRAIKKFDYKRGNRFTTYAWPWIRQAISRSVRNDGRTIRIPVHMGDLIHKVYQTKNALEQKLGREATEKEIAEEMKGVFESQKTWKRKTKSNKKSASKEEIAKETEKRLQRVRELIRYSQFTISLDEPTDDEEDENALKDFVADETSPSPTTETEKKNLAEKVNELLGVLSPREELIIRYRWGLVDGEIHTLEEVGKRLGGLTRERIRQIEDKALQRVRDVAEKRELQELL